MSYRSQPYFFAFDGPDKIGKPGFMHAHCVRIETIEIELEGGKNDDTKFSILGCDYHTNPLVKKLIDCCKRTDPGNFDPPPQP